MPANYDSSQPGAVFRRVDRIAVDYPTPNTASIRANETDAVVEIGGGVAKKADTRTIAIDYAPQDLQTGWSQLVDPVSGADMPGIPGGWLTLLQQGKMPTGLVMLGMLAELRKRQKAVDAEEAAAE